MLDRAGRLEGALADRSTLASRYGWQFLPPAQQIAHARNLLFTRLPDGTRRDFIELVDQISGTTECLGLHAFVPGSATPSVNPCAPDLTRNPAPWSIQTGPRTGPMGVLDLAELADGGLAPTDGLLLQAPPESRPLPDADFWLDSTQNSLRCDRDALLIADLPGEAQARVQAYMQSAQYYWGEYNSLFPGSHDDPEEFDRLEALAYDAWAQAQGWRAIYMYRLDVQRRLRAVARAAGYDLGGEISYILTEDDCTSPVELRLQAEYGWIFSSMDTPPVAPLGGETTLTTRGTLSPPGGDGLLYESDIGRPGAHPHYWSGRMTSDTAPVTHDAAAARRDPDADYPVGFTHWDSPYDVDHSSSFFTSLACQAPAGSLFAPDIEYITPGYRAADEQVPVLTPTGWQTWTGGVVHQDGTPLASGSLDHLEAPFRREAIANECEILNADYGTGDCYSSPELLARLAAIGGSGTTLTAAAVAAHNEVASQTVPYIGGPVGHGSTRPAGHGTYQVDQDSFVATDSEFTETFRSTYALRSSGDLDLDGNLIVYDPAPSLASTPYQVVLHSMVFHLIPPTLARGVPELHGHVTSAARGHGIAERYFGFGHGTCVGNPDCHADADDETYVRRGPVRYIGAMDWPKQHRYGACTLCSENGCSGDDLQFTTDRFTGAVRPHAYATGEPRMVCLVQPRAHAPVFDCPGP